MAAVSDALGALHAHMANVVEEKRELLQHMGLLCSGWFVLYALFRHVLCRGLSADFANRAVSFVHAVVAFGLCVREINFATWVSQVGSPTTESQLQVLAFSLAYFFYDFVCCLFIEIDIGNIFHHTVTLIGLYVGVFEGGSGTELVVCLAMMEASNPFMHGRSMAKELGLGSSMLATANDIMFALTFVFFRIIFGPFMLYVTLASPNTNIYIKVASVGVQAISLIWFWKILQIALYKMGMGKKKKAKKAE